MNDQQKIALIKKINSSNYDWMESFRQTFRIRDSWGLPSGLTGAEADSSLIRRVLDDKPVIIKER